MTPESETYELNERQLAISREMVNGLYTLCSETALHLADAGCTVAEAVNMTALTMVRLAALAACRIRILGLVGTNA